MALRFLIGTKSSFSPLSFIRLNRSLLRNISEEAAESTPEKKDAEYEHDVSYPLHVRNCVNEVNLIGRLTAEPKEKELADLRSAVFASLATDHFFRNPVGTMSKTTVYHQLIFRNQEMGNFASKYLIKGSRIQVSGSLVNVRIPGENDGSDSFLTCVRVDKLTPLSRLIHKPSNDS